MQCEPWPPIRRIRAACGWDDDSTSARLDIRQLLAAVAAGSALAAGLSVLPASAQMSMTEVRAANLARMEAERLNGGLNKTCAANCMHQKGGGDCMVNAGPNGYLFNFFGGPPGWEVNKQAATKATRILVSSDGTSVVNAEYNGSPR